MKRNAVLASVAALLFAASAQAVTYDVTIAFDTDRKTTTGCTLTTPAGTFAGVEQVVVTHVNVVGSTATTTGVTRQACSGGSFGAAVPVDPNTWPAGLTATGNLFIETHVAPSDLGLSSLTPMRVGFFVTDGTRTDSLMSGHLGEILLVPDGLKHRAVTSPPSSRTITLDGNDNDWTGVSPLSTGGSGNAALRILSALGLARSDNIFFAFRVQANPSAPTAHDDTYSLPTVGGTLSVPAASGVLANDNDPNSLALTTILVTDVQHGTLTLNPNGGFDYTNDGSSATLDTFEYKDKNTNQLESNVAQVQIGIGAGGGPNPPPTPAFTSADHATFNAGTFNTFTVVTTPAHPTPAITFSGPLPNGVSFTDNGDGTATISGTPFLNTGGVYHLTLTATNVVGTAHQDFTLTVVQGPSFTSANGTTFTVGQNGTFLVTAFGFPAPAITRSGALPSGVSFADNGNGSAILQGTPAAGTGGIYTLLFTATNTAGSATQTFTLTVNEAPSISTPAVNQTVCAGGQVTFTATANGFPTPTVQWKVSTNGGGTFNDIPGATSTTLTFTSSAGQNGNQYRAVFTNGLGSAQTTALLTVNVPPTVTTNPVSQTICAGSPVTFTAAATATPAANVQWQVSTNGGGTFNNIAGATTGTLTFTTAATDNGNQYRAVFTNTCGSSNSTAATLTVNVGPAVTSQPNNVTVCAGATATFTVAASGTPAPTVQWQVNSGSGFNNIPGATSTTLSFATVAADNGKQYRAVLTNSCGSVNSNAVLLTVNTSPVVTTNPLTQTVCAGSSVSFTAAASASPAASVQWQVDTGSGFNNIPGATTATLTFTAAASQSGNQFRAVFTNTCGTATTTAATLTVNVAPAVTTQPLAQTVCAGATATFTAAASGTPSPTVQWQVDSGSGFNNIPGATSTTLSFATVAGDNGKQYRAVFTNSCGTATTNAVALRVDTLAVVSTNPLTQTICAGSPVTFTAAASSNAGQTVQWQVDSGSGFTDIAGATSTSLTFITAAGDNGKQYRAVFTNACGSVNTAAATLVIDTLPVVTTDPVDQAVCPGGTATFTAAATSNAGDHTVQWQVDSGSGFTNIPGATSTTLSFTVAPADNGKKYRAVFTDACGSTNSAAATLTVNSAPVVTSNPNSQTVCAGATATFTAAASGVPTPTVQWQVDSGSGFTDIPGATSTTLSFATTPADNGKQYRARFTNVCGSNVATSAATLTVDTLPVVTTNPLTQTVCAGGTATFTAAATSNASDHTVQWQVDSGSGFTDIPGATSTTLSFATVAGDNGKQYRAVFTDACGSANTTAATLTVDTLPVVTTDPLSQTVCAGATATFTAAATSNASDHTVQWQVDSGSGFTNIPGATSTTLSFATVAGDNGKKYRAVFTTACGSTNSAAATLTVDTLPVVTSDPVTQTVCSGAPVTFTAAATSNASDHTVQWQVNTGSGFTDIPGATSTTLNFVAANGDNGNQYRAVFTDACGSTNSAAATLTVDTLPTVSTDPVSQTACAGGTATFTAAATSNANDQTVQWQVDSGSGFTNIPGATSTTLSFATAPGDNGKKYRAVFTTACGSTNTAFATLTVDTLPVVTTNPLTQTVCAGATATFTAAATSNASDHTVQWQVDSGSGFTDIPGATSTTLSFATVAGDNGKKYRAVFTDACGSANTTAATLTVDTLPVVTTDPVSQSICSGSPVTFTAAATSNASDHTVQWQVDSGSGFTNIPGATSTTLSFSTVAGDNGKKYRAVFTTACGSTNTAFATLTVDTLPVVTTNPLTQTVCAGATVTFTAAATSNASDHTVQWQVDSGSGFTDIPGATSTTLSFATVAGDNGKKYRAVFTDACGPANTTAATLTVDTLPVVTTDPVSQSICSGSPVTFTAAATSNASDHTVQWQVDSGSGFTNIPGATSTTLTFTVAAGDNGKQYRAVFTTSCGSTNTAAATLTVTTAPSVTANPVDSTVCAGSTATFTASATGNPTPTVQWQVDSGSGFTNIPGATSTTLSFSTVAGDNGKKYRAVFTNVCGTATTTAATLTVNVAPVVTTDPISQSIQSGNSVTFTAAASGTPAPTVQWQVNTGSGFTDIPGATSTSLTFTTTLSQSGNQYRAVFTNSCGTATTAVATLTVTCPTITPARTGGGTFPAGTFNSAYTGQSFTATGGATPHTFAVTGGTFPPGLNLASGGAITGTPTATGTFNFTVTATEAGPGTCTGSASFSIAINPAATGDSYSNLVNNTQAAVTGGVTTSPTTPFVPLTGFITANDLPSGGVAVVTGTFSSANGTNNVVIAADGSFLYTPPVTASPLTTDSFTYTINSNTGGTGTPTSATGTVTLNLSGRVWYIKNNGAAGNGQSQSPFNTAASFTNGARVTPDTAGDIIYVYQGDGLTTNQNSGIALLANEQLIGQGVALVVNTVTLVPAGTKPLIGNTTGAAVTLANGNTLKGFTATTTVGATLNGISGTSLTTGPTIDTVNVGPTTGAGLNITASATITTSLANVTISNAGTTGINMSNFGTLTVGASVSVSGAQALVLSTGAVSGTFANVSSTGGTNGVSLTTVTGTWGAAAGALTGASGATFNVSGGSGGTITWAGTINQANAGTAVTIAGNNSNTINFTNNVTTSGTSAGLSIGASSGTYAFSGGGPNTIAGSGGGIAITSATGTITFNNAFAISQTSTNASFSVTTASANITYSGTISNVTATSKVLAINGYSTGTLTMNGTSLVGSVAGAGGITSTLANVTGTVIINNLSITASQNAFAGTLVGISGTNTAGSITFNHLVLSANGNNHTGQGLVDTGTGGSVVITATGGASTFDTGGAALSLNGQAVGTSAIGTLTCTAPAAASCVSLTSVTGSLTIGGGAITGNTAAAFAVSGGTVSVSNAATIAQASNAAAVSVSGGHATGTLTFSANITPSAGTGLQFDNADGTYNISGATNTFTGTARVDILNGSSGSFTFSSGTSITNPGVTAFNVSGSNPTVTYSGAISTNNSRPVSVSNGAAAACGSITFQTGNITATAGSNGILVNNCNSGTISFNNPAVSLTTTTNTAVSLTTNAGATINFGSGGPLTISTTNGTGINATGGGTVNVSGTTSTISTTGSGAALSIVGTSGTHFGGSQTFQSINKSGSGTKGIVVNFSDGSFTVTGDGPDVGTAPDSATSGGTITGTSARGAEFISVLGGVNLAGMTFTNATTVDGGTSTECGVDLINNDNTTCNAPIFLQQVGGASGPGSPSSLNLVTVNGSTQTGINVFTIRNLNMTQVSVTASGNGSNEHGVVLKNLLGTSNVITNSSFTGNHSRQLYAINTITEAPTPQLAVTSTTLSGSVDAQGVLFDSYLSGNIIINFGDDTVGGHNTIQNNFSNGLQQSIGPGAQMTINVKRNTFTNNNSGVVLQASGVGATGTMTYTVWNNTVTTGALSGSSAIIAGGTQQHQMTGDIRGNTVGNGTVGSGAKCGGGCSGIVVNHNDISAGGGGRHDVTIIGNTVGNVDQTGIVVNIGRKSKGNVTITGNLVQNPDGNVFAGIWVTSGVAAGDTSCVAATIGGTVNPGAWPSLTANAMNQINGSWDPGGFQSEIFVQNIAGTLNIPGGSAPFATFIAGRNSIPDATGPDVTTAGTISNGASCP